MMGPGADQAPERRRRMSRDALAVGVALTVLLHAGIVGAIVAHEHAHAGDLLLIPRDPVVARIARLGRKRDLSWLPHKNPPARVHRARAPGLTEDENARPRPISKDRNEQVTDHPKDQPDQSLVNAEQLARTLAQSEAANDDTADTNAPRWGDPNGSAAGNSETGSASAWVAALEAAMQWNVPATIAPEVAAKLACTVDLQIAGGVLSDYRIVKQSGNDIFDQAVELTLRQAKEKKTALPDPPPEYRARAEAGELAIVFGEKAQ